jgi:hypothetical protein
VCFSTKGYRHPPTTNTYLSTSLPT